MLRQRKTSVTIQNRRPTLMKTLMIQMIQMIRKTVSMVRVNTLIQKKVPIPMRIGTILMTCHTKTILTIQKKARILTRRRSLPILMMNRMKSLMNRMKMAILARQRMTSLMKVLNVLKAMTRMLTVPSLRMMKTAKTRTKRPAMVATPRMVRILITRIRPTRVVRTRIVKVETNRKLILTFLLTQIVPSVTTRSHWSIPALVTPML